jgi:hypothetical protein
MVLKKPLNWHINCTGNYNVYLSIKWHIYDFLCGLVVRVPGSDPEVLGLIPGATRFSEK